MIRSLLAALMLTAGLAAVPAGAQTAPAAPAVQVPPVPAQLALLRGAIEAVNQGNETGNYTVLYMLGSDRFRKANSLDVLAQGFAGFRARKVSLNAALVLNPQLRQPAAIENGTLHLVGFVPASPEQILFDLRFEPQDGRWRILGVNLSLAAAPAAGAAPAPAAAKPAPKRN